MSWGRAKDGTCGYSTKKNKVSITLKRVCKDMLQVRNARTLGKFLPKIIGNSTRQSGSEAYEEHGRKGKEGLKKDTIVRARGR